MTSKPSPASLRLELRPSRWLLLYLISAHGLAAGALILAPVAASLQLLALALTAFSLLFHVMTLYHRRWRCEVLLRDEKGWCLQIGRLRRPVELKSCWVTPYAVGMRFRGRGLLLPADAFVSADGFRRLRVQLRFAPGLKNSVSGLR
ncbi:hypothetical protein FHR99_000229 [Litorivivens lipolytica]|uniref:Toxin CptA n=1 Tax=Litorivivens lipolytica TaxID=1524264 RepID=A0A7W4Z4D5_9GAMM|nr:protein YgfX [Litorivivens lipolytica]MBB3045993.1 hypothetical protein [Litorivivens lipolytica]